MRFFKFLHRRTKSDSAIPSSTPAPWDHILRRPQSLDAAQAALFAPFYSQTFLFPTPADASNAIFELETTNSRLRGELSTCTTECTQLRTQLDHAQTDLFRQLHQNSLLQHQVQADKLAIEDLQGTLAKYERFLSLMITVGLHQRVLGDAHAALRAGLDPDMALVDAIKEAAAVPGSAWSTIIPSVTGPRTPNEYRSSLNMTLQARRDLRDTRKLAKFWKRVAHEAGQSGVVTPSVSAISSIHEALPPERQKAVDELISARRRSSVASQEVLATAESTEQLPTAAVLPTSISSNSTSSPTPDEITPSVSVSHAPPLSPLASESFKTELASLSSNTRLSKSSAPKPVRAVLGQLDPNVLANRGQPSHKSSMKRDSGTENRVPEKNMDSSPAKLLPRPRELAVTNVVPSFSKHSLCSAHLGPLGRIEEEHEDLLETEPPADCAETSADVTVDEDSTWTMLFPDPDLSFSFCDTVNFTPSRTPEKANHVVENITTPTKTSRLPKPVLRQLNRMSFTKPAQKSDAPVSQLAVRKRSAGGFSSPTRLSTSSMNGRRTVWRV